MISGVTAGSVNRSRFAATVATSALTVLMSCRVYPVPPVAANRLTATTDSALIKDSSAMGYLTAEIGPMRSHHDVVRMIFVSLF